MFKKRLSPKEAKDILKGKDTVLIDVRSKEEYLAAHLKAEGSEFIPINEDSFETKMNKLDKNKTYVIVCAHGIRSKHAMNVAKKLGFDKVYDIKGGLQAWVEDDLPLDVEEE